MDIPLLGPLIRWFQSLFFAKHLQIAILGLQSAGKTSLVNVLSNGQFSEEMVPTVGFNMRKMSKGNVQIKMWDIGGQPRFRSMWERYCRGVSAIVFVVDSAIPRPSVNSTTGNEVKREAEGAGGGEDKRNGSDHYHLQSSASSNKESQSTTSAAPDSQKASSQQQQQQQQSSSSPQSQPPMIDPTASRASRAAALTTAAGSGSASSRLANIAWHTATEELHALISRPELAGIPLLVLATKNDVKGAASVEEVIKVMRLDGLRNREVSCYSISSKTQSNIPRTLQWLCNRVPLGSGSSGGR